MKPFYSIKELSRLLGEDYFSVADGLSASGIKMISNGEAADLSKWRRPGGTHADGSVFVVTGTYLIPNPEHVIVATEALPDAWLKCIQKSMAIGGIDSSGPRDERKYQSAVNTIAALASAWPGGWKSKKPSAKDLEKAARIVGVSISDDTIRKIISEVEKEAPMLSSA